MTRLLMRRTFWIASAAAIIATNSFRLRAQSVPPAFEVASIKPHQGPLSRIMDFKVSGPRVTMEAYSVFLLVLDAYHLKGNYQISLAAVPRQENEIREVMYDVVARAPGETAPARDEIRKMLQTLLADRFKLAIHRETKEMPVYALMAGKNGPGLKSSAVGDPCSMHQKLASDGRNYEETFSNCPIEALVKQLEQLGIDRPVVDKTSLAGTYDFRLVVTPELRSHSASDLDITTSTALRELGLKLESQKAPIEIVVIDQVKKPTEN
jgi:uncharacterized protein (TIGR03435 family)